MEKERSYADEKHLYASSWDIPYKEMLQFREWKEFRRKILLRDNGSCKICRKTATEKYRGIHYRTLSEEESLATQTTEETTLVEGFTFTSRSARFLNEPTDSAVILHAHHRYYTFGDAPWEYPESAMITVCHDCHWNIHAQGKIPTYSDETRKDVIPLDPCIRCNGTGFLKEYYYHQDGICFRCSGRKFEQYIKPKLSTS